MTTETEQINDLLRDFVASFIDHGQALALTAEEFPGAVYWEMRVHADDYGKAVGRAGAHVKALAFLVKSFGTAREELHKFKLHEPEPGRRRDDLPAKTADTFDPTPAKALLERVLANLGLGDFAVGVVSEPRIPLAFTFQIAVRTDEDYRALTVPPDASNGLTAVGSIGTLFRAYANKAGVKFQIEVLRP